MKRFMYLLITGCFFTVNALAASPINMPGSDDYFVNDQKIEQLFASSTDISLAISSESLLANSSQSSFVSNKAFYAPGEKNFVAALLLNIFVGGLGIHRAYLGTKPLTWIGYILTCGGIFGVVPLIDLIVLIIHNDDISPYVDNPKFFMWGEGKM